MPVASVGTHRPVVSLRLSSAPHPERSMSPNLSFRTFDLVAQLFQLPRLRPAVSVRAAAGANASMPAASAIRRAARTSLPACVIEPGRATPVRTDAAVELRSRLVREYRLRLDLVRATLASMDDAWARAARAEAADLDHQLALWEAHVGDACRAGEPALDLHALGDDVLALVARISGHLAGECARG